MAGIFPNIEESKPVLPRGTANKWYKIEEDGKVPANIVPLYGRVSFFGEEPEVTFAQLMNYYERTPQIKLAVDYINGMIFGTDLIINVDQAYEKAKEILEKWNAKVGFYEKLESLGITFLVCGNALLEKLSEKTMNDVAEVDMSTIVGKHRDESGLRVQYYVQQVPGYPPKQLGEEYKDKAGNIDAHIRFVEFNLTNYSRKDWGRSLFYSGAVPRKVNGVFVKPLIEDFWEIEDAMSRIFHNFASPMMFVTYENADKDFIDKKIQEFKKLKPGDALIGTRKPEFDIIESDARAKFDKFIDHMDSSFEVMTQFSNQLFTAGYTARASSQTTHDLINKTVRKIQKYICDKIKNEIYKPILIINGYKEDDINKMNMVISFENDDFTEFIPQDIVNMVMNGIMTPNEARNWAKNQGLDLFEDDWAMKWRKDWYDGQITQGPVGDISVENPPEPAQSAYTQPPEDTKESKKHKK